MGAKSPIDGSHGNAICPLENHGNIQVDDIIIVCRTKMLFIVLYCIVGLFYFALHCILYCILYCIVLYCIVLLYFIANLRYDTQ